MNPDFKIRTAQGHFWKFYRVREKAIGWKSNTQRRMNPDFKI